MRAYYENEWMPKVIPLGTTYNDFWQLNPRKIDIMVAAYNEAKKNEIRTKNMLYHLEGMYFADALCATVGNMFRGRGQKPFEYPKEPYTLDMEFEDGLNMSDEEERKIAKQRKQFVTQLNTMFSNVERALKEKEDAEY